MSASATIAAVDVSSAEIAAPSAGDRFSGVFTQRDVADSPSYKSVMAAITWKPSPVKKQADLRRWYQDSAESFIARMKGTYVERLLMSGPGRSLDGLVDMIVESILQQVAGFQIVGAMGSAVAVKMAAKNSETAARKRRETKRFAEDVKGKEEKDRDEDERVALHVHAALNAALAAPIEAALQARRAELFDAIRGAFGGLVLEWDRGAGVPAVKVNVGDALRGIRENDAGAAWMRVCRECFFPHPLLDAAHASETAGNAAVLVARQGIVQVQFMAESLRAGESLKDFMTRLFWWRHAFVQVGLPASFTHESVIAKVARAMASENTDVKAEWRATMSDFRADRAIIDARGLGAGETQEAYGEALLKLAEVFDDTITLAGTPLRGASAGPRSGDPYTDDAVIAAAYRGQNHTRGGATASSARGAVPVSAPVSAVPTAAPGATGGARQFRPDGKCWMCGVLGHPWFRCPRQHEFKCASCGVIGHPAQALVCGPMATGAVPIAVEAREVAATAVASAPTAGTAAAAAAPAPARAVSYGSVTVVSSASAPARVVTAFTPTAVAAARHVSAARISYAQVARVAVSASGSGSAQRAPVQNRVGLVSVSGAVRAASPNTTSSRSASPVAQQASPSSSRRRHRRRSPHRVGVVPVDAAVRSGSARSVSPAQSSSASLREHARLYLRLAAAKDRRARSASPTAHTAPTAAADGWRDASELSVRARKRAWRVGGRGADSV
jgi:hypothetical protein